MVSIADCTQAGKRRRATWRAVFAGSLAVLFVAGTSAAQELAPRAYWPTPTGTKLALAGYSYSSGDVVTDASLPITGVDSRINSAVVGYQQTLALLDRTASIKFELPYVVGTTTGSYLGVPARADVSGMGDVALTLSINLLGAPAMNREEFRELLRDPGPILGASIRVIAPTGEYDGDKLINIGTNRWAARLQLGYIQPLGRQWALEMAGGAWFFGTNDNFLGYTREQDPIAAIEVHLIRVTKAGIWASLDGNYYAGGRSYLDNDSRADFQRNSRMGITIAWPIQRRHLIKAGYSQGVATESGGDYAIASLSYAVAIN